MSGAVSFRGPILAMLAVAAIGTLLLVVTAAIRFADDQELTSLRSLVGIQREIIEAYRGQRDDALAASQAPSVRIPPYTACPPPRLLRHADPPRVVPVFR